MALSELKKWPKNPKLHADEAIQKSITGFGFKQPILIDEKSGYMVAGHGRLDALVALKEQGKDPPENIRVQKAEWLVPVIRGIRFKDEKELEAYLIADNQTTIAGGWDEVKLAEILEQMHPDLQALTAFEPTEIKELIANLPRTDLDPSKEDVIPEVSEPISKLGDIWQLGEHRIMCGDATKQEDMNHLTGGVQVDFCLTDPPYNVGKHYENNSDQQSMANYEAFSRSWFELVKNHLVVFTPGTGLRLRNLLMWFGIQTPTWIAVWIKTNSTTHSPLQGFQAWEPIFVYGKPDKKVGQDVFNYPIENQYVDKEPLNKLHPTPKLLAFWVDLLQSFSDRKNVLDPFLGSGTTLIAAEKLGRICYGMEIEPRYVDVAVKRWEQYTGRKAELVQKT